MRGKVRGKARGIILYIFHDTELKANLSRGLLHVSQGLDLIILLVCSTIIDDLMFCYSEIKNRE